MAKNPRTMPKNENRTVHEHATGARLLNNIVNPDVVRKLNSICHEILILAMENQSKQACSLHTETSYLSKTQSLQLHCHLAQKHTRNCLPERYGAA